MATAAVGTRLEVRLLGPVEAVRDGVPVQLGPRQRALLAVLALRANEQVSVERLVASLFGGDASETPNAVQVAVSRLRRQLGADAVETHAGGYLLRLPPGQLDTAEFERLAAEGRRLLDDGEPGAAVAPSKALSGCSEATHWPTSARTSSRSRRCAVWTGCG
jgi:DNA-binding SARP family transcriptional activator